MYVYVSMFASNQDLKLLSTMEPVLSLLMPQRRNIIGVGPRMCVCSSLSFFCELRIQRDSWSMGVVGGGSVPGLGCLRHCYVSPVAVV